MTLYNNCLHMSTSHTVHCCNSDPFHRLELSTTRSSESLWTVSHIIILTHKIVENKQKIKTTLPWKRNNTDKPQFITNIIPSVN